MPLSQRRYLLESSPKQASRVLFGFFAGAFVALFWLQTQMTPKLMGEVYQDLGLSWEGVRKAAFWQFFTYAFLHGSWFHVICNAAFFAVLGPKLSWILSVKQVSGIVALGIICGGVFHISVMTFSESAQILVGVSGGIFAMLFLFIGLSPESRMWPVPVRGRSLGRATLFVLVAMIVLNPQYQIIGFSSVGKWLVVYVQPNFFQGSDVCHLGGSIVGILSAKWILRTRVN